MRVLVARQHDEPDRMGAVGHVPQDRHLLVDNGQGPPVRAERQGGVCRDRIAERADPGRIRRVGHVPQHHPAVEADDRQDAVRPVLGRCHVWDPAGVARRCDEAGDFPAGLDVGQERLGGRPQHQGRLRFADDRRLGLTGQPPTDRDPLLVVRLGLLLGGFLSRLLGRAPVLLGDLRQPLGLRLQPLRLLLQVLRPLRGLVRQPLLFPGPPRRLIGDPLLSPCLGLRLVRQPLPLLRQPLRPLRLGRRGRRQGLLLARRLLLPARLRLLPARLLGGPLGAAALRLRRLLLTQRLRRRGRRPLRVTHRRHTGQRRQQGQHHQRRHRTGPQPAGPAMLPDVLTLQLVLAHPVHRRRQLGDRVPETGMLQAQMLAAARPPQIQEQRLLGEHPPQRLGHRRRVLGEVVTLPIPLPLTVGHHRQDPIRRLRRDPVLDLLVHPVRLRGLGTGEQHEVLRAVQRGLDRRP
ncbi:hypothetical protein ACFQFC_13025 [Amorphoplanes digitatis]|uniref:hypothetical protein n=1 Tax=Actinoplanes digitatis TaxID=1868 RepID=UPI00361978D3